eukprot:gene10873-7538_t
MIRCGWGSQCIPLPHSSLTLDTAAPTVYPMVTSFRYVTEGVKIFVFCVGVFDSSDGAQRPLEEGGRSDREVERSKKRGSPATDNTIRLRCAAYPPLLQSLYH